MLYRSQDGREWDVTLDAPGKLLSVAPELERRELLLQEANGRLRQALEVADICLTTADQLEKTLTSYQALLRGTVPAAVAD